MDTKMIDTAQHGAMDMIVSGFAEQALTEARARRTHAM